MKSCRVELDINLPSRGQAECINNGRICSTLCIEFYVYQSKADFLHEKCLVKGTRMQMQTPESRCHSKIMFARRNIPSTAPLPSVVHIMIYEGIVNSAILFTSINLLIIRCHSSPHPSTARLNKSLTYKVNSKRRYRRGPSASGPPS